MKLVVVVLAVLVLGSCACKHERVERVQVTEAREIAVPLVLRLPAVIYPKRQSTIIPEISAPIRELRAEPGDFIEAGDVLAVLDNRDLLAQQEAALAALEDAKATLRRAASAGTYADEAERSRTRLPEPGGRNLAANAIPKMFDPAVSAAEQRVRDAQARIDTLQKALAGADVRTPMSGTVIARLADIGDTATPAGPIFTIADLSTVIARAPVSEAVQKQITDNATCSFVSKDGRSQTVEGKLMPPRPGSAWCEMPNKIGLLLKQSGELSIDTKRTRAMVAIPTSAIHNEGQRDFVYVVDPARLAHRRFVVLGVVTGSNTTIESGVHTGDMVITGGTASDGAHVTF